MPADGELNRVCNDFTADKGGLHPLMAHGDAISHCYRIETARHTAALLYTHTRNVRLGIERSVAWCAVVTCGYHTDKWPRNFLGS